MQITFRPKDYAPLTSLEIGCAICTADCQRRDWKIQHKIQCPILQSINGCDVLFRGERPLTPDGFMEMKHRQYHFTYFDDNIANQYVGDQIKCEVCFRTPAQKSTSNSFLSCDRCHLSWFCSDNCKTKFPEYHTKTQCDMLTMAASVERLHIDYGIDRRWPHGGSLKMASRGPGVRRYVPLSTLKSWDDYFRHMFGSLREFQQGCTRLSAPFKSNNPDAERSWRLLAEESNVAHLTALAALELAVKGLPLKEELCIHFAGSATREASTTGMMEDVLHFLPKLKKLTIFYVGPEASELAKRDGENLACSECASRGRARYYSIHALEYDRFAQSSKYVKPDVIVALNTGMSEVATRGWTKNLDFILEQNIAAAFTAYTFEEAKMEVDMLSEMGTKFMRGVEKNQWRGVVPILNNYTIKCVDGQNGYDPSFNGHYWYVVQGKKKKQTAASSV